MGSATTVLNIRLNSQTTALNFGFGRRIKEFDVGFGSQTAVLNFRLGSRTIAVTSWRSESSNVSLVILEKLIFVKKKSIIDGAVKVESLLNTDNMSSKVVSFLKESSRLDRLHIDGTEFITNCKG